MLTLLLALATSASAADCLWCVNSQTTTKKEVTSLAKKEPAALLKAVRDTGTCVKVLRSGRPAPGSVFTWGKVEAPTGDLASVTKQKGLVGKTLCQGEIPLAKDCTTIVLADDAPKSTLLHEYLHVLQMKNDPAWCPLSKKLWSSAPTADETKVIRDKEWDVHRFLWENRDELALAIEDKVTIADETITEAKLRQAFDPGAAGYLKEQSLEAELSRLLPQYVKTLQGSR